MKTVSTSFLTLLIFIVVGGANAQSFIPIPAHGTNFTGSVRGFYFTAPTNFLITGLRVPSEAGSGLQYIQLVKLNVVPPVFSASTTNFTNLAFVNGTANGVINQVNVLVNQGDIIGVLGQAGTTTSYATPVGTFNSNILGHPVVLERILYQGQLQNGLAGPISTEGTPQAIGRVEIYFTSSSVTDHDAGLSAMSIDTGACGGLFQDVRVRLRNFGVSQLSSATIGWEVNGLAQAPYAFSGLLDTIGGSGPTDTILTIGSYLLSGSTSYSVKAWSEMPNGFQDTVNLNDTVSVSFTTKPDPQPAPTIFTPSQSVCSGSSALLSASGTATLTWYSDSQLSNKIGVGNNILSPSVFAATTFYVANDSGTISNVGPITMSELGAGGFTTSFLTSGVIFDVFSDCNIHSVKVFTGAAGSVTVNLANNSTPTAFLSSVTAQVTGDPNGDRIIVNFNVEAGKTYRLVGTGTTVSGGLWRNSAVPGGTGGGDWNFTIPNMLKVRTSTSNTTLYYYNFYDWEVGTTTGCPGVDSMTVNISPVPPTPNFSYTVTDNVVQFTNLTNSGATYSWDFGDLTTSTAVNPTKAYSNTGVYFVTLTASNGCVSNLASAPQAVNITSMGQQEMSLDGHSFHVYPNPSDGHFNVHLGNSLLGSNLSIIDMQGRAVKTMIRLNELQNEIDLTSEPKGIYFLRVQSQSKVFVEKIVVD